MFITVKLPTRCSFCSTMPMWRPRKRSSCADLSRDRSCPAITTLPAPGRNMPASICNSVVLPLPEGPSTKHASPCATCHRDSSSTRLPRYSCQMSSRSINSISRQLCAAPEPGYPAGRCHSRHPPRKPQAPWRHAASKSRTRWMRQIAFSCHCRAGNQFDRIMAQVFSWRPQRPGQSLARPRYTWRVPFQRCRVEGGGL